MKMKKSDFQRYSVAFVALIFIGSMAGAMLYSAGDGSGTLELPKELIQTQLSDAQRQFILSKGYVIIDAEIPSSCYLECAAAKRGLEQMVLALNPAAYLVEVPAQSAAFDIPVSMDSYRGKKALAAFNQTAAEDFICENTPFRIDGCVLRKMDFRKPESNVSQKAAEGGVQGGGINGTSGTNATGQGSGPETGSQNRSG